MKVQIAVQVGKSFKLTVAVVIPAAVLLMLLTSLI